MNPDPIEKLIERALDNDVETGIAARTAYAALKERLERAERDAARLDWLDSRGNWWAPGRHVDGYEQISRASVDRAMQMKPLLSRPAPIGGGKE